MSKWQVYRNVAFWLALAWLSTFAQAALAQTPTLDEIPLPHRPSILCRTACELADEGKYDEAMRCIDAARNIDPDYTDRLGAPAYVYFKQGKVEAALEENERALSISPKSPHLLNNRVFFLMQLDRKAELPPALNELLEVEPTHLSSLFLRGKLHAHNRDFDAAILDFEYAIILHPREPDLLHAMGVCMAYTDRMAEAMAFIDGAINLDPTNPNFYYDRARILMAAEDYDRAALDFEKARTLRAAQVPDNAR